MIPEVWLALALTAPTSIHRLDQSHGTWFLEGDATRIPADIGPTRLQDSPTGYETLFAEVTRDDALAGGLHQMARAGLLLPHDPAADRRAEACLREHRARRRSVKSSKRGKPDVTLG